MAPRICDRHALLAPAPGWGQNRPLICLAAKIVHEHPRTIVTFTMVGDYQSRLENELNRYFNDEEKSLKKNIRILHLGGFGISDRPKVYQAYFEGFAKAYPRIYGEKPVPCATGWIFSPVTRPSVIVLDPFLYEALQTVRRVSGDSIPALLWYTPDPNTLMRFVGASGSREGLGYALLKAEAMAEETGKPIDEVLSDLYQRDTNEVIKLPGIPEMYGYELQSHHFGTPVLGNQNTVVLQAFKFFEECDGSISVANESFQPEACAAYRAYFASRPVYFLGPLIPDEISTGNEEYKSLSNTQERDITGSSSGAEVKAFLDTILEVHGDNSLLYMSFGSQHWPSGDGVWKLVEVILDMKIPLIFSHDPKRAEMPHHIQEQFRASKLAIVSAWTPQYMILGHKATGWFLTHCGYNSITEAVSCGVPMIAFPLGADQPLVAAYISSSLNIAYELFETRIGAGLKVLRRGIQPDGTLEAIEKEARTVFGKAWGPDGAQKRENVRALADKLNSAWNEGGESRKEFQRFCSSFI